MVKTSLALLAALFSLNSFAAETGPANSVNVIPPNGGPGKYRSFDESYELRGVGIKAAVSANALIVSVVQKDGSTNCSSTAPCLLSFRSTTATNGGYSLLAITGSLSTTVRSSDTLGHISNVPEYVYIYVLNDAGTPDICVAGGFQPDEALLQSSTQITGAAKTSRTTLYCGLSHSGSLAVRYVGRLDVTETTAGTWASAPTNVASKPAELPRAMTNGSKNSRVEYLATAAACGSSPCTIDRQSGVVSSMTRTSAGVYVVNFSSGTWSEKPTCVCTTGQNSGSGVASCVILSESTTAVTVETFNATPSADDVLSLKVVCAGGK